MKNLYKLKRYCHIFINNIFYFIVFILGFLFGFFGKEIIKIPNVFAIDLDFTETVRVGGLNYYKYYQPYSSDYENLPSYYENKQLLKKMQMIIDYFKERHSEEYGITLGIQLAYADSEFTSVYNGSSMTTYGTTLQIIVYKKDGYVPVSEYTGILKKQFKIDVYMQYDQYKDVYGLSATYNSAVVKNENIRLKDDDLLFSSTIDEFNDYLENEKFDILRFDLENYSNTLTGGSTNRVRNNQTDAYADFFLYYSDVEIEANSKNTQYVLNDTLMNTNDVWIDYYHWKLEHPDEPSVLDGLTYVCTDKPFALSEGPEGSLTDHRLYETFNSKIYFDYDIPKDLYPYLFDFYEYYRATGYQARIFGYSNRLENPFGWFTDTNKDDQLYSVPFVIDMRKDKQSFFAVNSKFLEMKIGFDEDGKKIYDWSIFSNLSGYTVDYKTKYFYDFLVYKKLIDDTEYPFMLYKEFYTKASINNLLLSTYVSLDSISLKIAFVEYLFTVRNKVVTPDHICFYYDSANLNFSWLTFDEDGNMAGKVVTDGKIQDVVVSTNPDIFIKQVVSEFVINDNLRGPLSYLSKMIEQLWNSFPSGLKVVFISVFSLTLIFMILRMVGWYG